MLPVPARRHDPELMDRDNNTSDDLEGALSDIRLVNRYLGGRRVLLREVAPYLEAGNSVEILDVGTGGGDLPLALSEAAAVRCCALSVTAVDSDPVTAAIAHRACATRKEIRVLRADAFSLPFSARSFDVVTASMFLHHFGHRDVVRLLRRFVRLARRAVLINDLRRDWLPWGFIYIVARATRRHPMFVHDAPLSVLRGFTAVELLQAAQDAGAEGARVRYGWPYRISMTLMGSGA